MSMLSAQCDELRAMAESVGLAMPQAATLMMEAADALDSLDLALDSKRIAERRVTKLLTENAKLREERDMYRDLVGCMVHPDISDQLQAENAKLRELAEEACEMARTFYNLGGTFNDLDDLLCEAAELGVEVDE